MLADTPLPLPRSARAVRTWCPVHTRLKVIRLQRERLFQALHGLVKTLEFAQRIAFAKQRIEIVGMLDDGRAIRRQGFVVALCTAKRRAEVQLGIDEIRRLCEHDLELLDSFSVATLLVQRDAEVVTRIGKRRIDGERAFLALHRVG